MNARALTGATGCAIVMIAKDGTPRDFVTSGIAEEEHQRLAQWPDRLRLFEHPRDLPEGVRIMDRPAHVRGLGFSWERIPPRSFRGTPTRHRGVHVGNFYLLKEECAGEFTAEDGEILALFASRAATAVTAARTHRAVERARADLEAVIETSPPVGVVVFDAVTGRPISINRESLRIVDRLRSPGGSPEALLGVVTCGLPDGHERRRVTMGGKRADLTATEYELLRALSLDAGRVSTYETLMRRVWGRRGAPTRSSPARS